MGLIDRTEYPLPFRKSGLSLKAVEAFIGVGGTRGTVRSNFGLGSIKRLARPLNFFGPPICEIRQQARLAITS